MVLVDTSVWIRYFRGSTPYASDLERLLELGAAAGHELVYGELLIGDSGGGGGRSQFLDSYSLFHQIPPVPHADVVHFVRAHRLYGKGIGWTDAHLLASALVAGVPLWTADQPLRSVATQLGAAYRPG